MYYPISRTTVLLAVLASCASLPAGATEPRYNQVSLRAEVSSEVAHDRMHVTLYSEAQHEDPAQLAAQTTHSLNQALRQARQVDPQNGKKLTQEIHGATGWPGP